jgi:hypothetical protein
MSGAVYIHRSGAIRRLSDLKIFGEVGWRQFRESAPVNKQEKLGLFLAQLDDLKAKSLELLGAPAELDALTPVVLAPLKFEGRVTAMRPEGVDKVTITIESEKAVREKIARLQLAKKEAQA